jgi:hypothetical protein
MTAIFTFDPGKATQEIAIDKNVLLCELSMRYGGLVCQGNLGPAEGVSTGAISRLREYCGESCPGLTQREADFGDGPRSEGVLRMRSDSPSRCAGFLMFRSAD